jgi:DNA-binding response OmpR family regulator
MNVLVVEGDFALGRFLEKGLRLEGHDVVLAVDAATALDCAGQRFPDLAILDMGMLKMGRSDMGRSDQNGGQLLAALTGKPRAASVLVLIGHEEREQGVRCLDMGADDVLHKPISFRELAARCRALERRREQFADPIVRHGEICMDRMARRVVLGSREVELTATEFRLLEALLARQGRCASRSDLLREVWQMEPEPGNTPTGNTRRTNIVEVYINYLRKKLDGPDALEVPGLAAARSAIRTVRGEGYRLDGLGSEPAGDAERAVLGGGVGRYAIA